MEQGFWSHTLQLVLVLTQACAQHTTHYSGDENPCNSWMEDISLHVKTSIDKHLFPLQQLLQVSRD